MLFEAALLENPRFASGDFHTGFIAEEYAGGFAPDTVKHKDPAFLVAMAARLHMWYRNRAQGLQGPFWEGFIRLPKREFTVCVLGRGGDNQYYKVSLGEVALHQPMLCIVHMPDGPYTYHMLIESMMGDVRVCGTANGKPFTVQMERRGHTPNPLITRVVHNGTQMDAIVMGTRTAELHRLMPYKAPPDMSKFTLSPMPGLLTEVSVKPGQKVQAGERLAVIEAMKMENILFANADGTVKAIKAQPGESLAVDQAIIEFE